MPAARSGTPDGSSTHELRRSRTPAFIIIKTIERVASRICLLAARVADGDQEARSMREGRRARARHRPDAVSRKLTRLAIYRDDGLSGRLRRDGSSSPPSLMFPITAPSTMR